MFCTDIYFHGTGNDWKRFWFCYDSWEDWQNRVPDADSIFLTWMTAECGISLPLLIDMILLTPLRNSQAAGFPFPDSLTPDVDHGFMLSHDHIDVAHLIHPPLTRSCELLGYPKTSMVMVRVAVQIRLGYASLV